MAKSEDNRKKIYWTLENDGICPNKTPWGFVVLNPMSTVVPPGLKREIRMEVKCDHPLVAFPLERRAEFISVKSIIYPGQMITVTAENTGTVPLLIDERESLIIVFPLVTDDIVAEVNEGP